MHFFSIWLRLAEDRIHLQPSTKLPSLILIKTSKFCTYVTETFNDLSYQTEEKRKLLIVDKQWLTDNCSQKQSVKMLVKENQMRKFSSKIQAEELYLHWTGFGPFLAASLAAPYSWPGTSAPMSESGAANCVPSWKQLLCEPPLIRPLLSRLKIDWRPFWKQRRGMNAAEARELGCLPFKNDHQETFKKYVFLCKPKHSPNKYQNGVRQRQTFGTYPLLLDLRPSDWHNRWMYARSVDVKDDGNSNSASKEQEIGIRNSDRILNWEIVDTFHAQQTTPGRENSPTFLIFRQSELFKRNVDSNLDLFTYTDVVTRFSFWWPSTLRAANTRWSRRVAAWRMI